MLSGKDLILATKPFAKEIRSKSWLFSLSTFFLLAFAETGTLLFHNIWIKAICSVGAGILIIRMFVIYHDHQHHTILYGSKFGNLIMTIFGIYMLAPTSIWKRSHDHHHKHNSKLFSASIGSYPIVTKNKFMQMSNGERRSYLASRHPLTILFGYFSMFVFGMCVNSFRSNPKKHFDSLLALIIHIAASVALFYFLGWQAWALTIFVPFSIACGLGAYLFYVQHNFPGVYFSANKEWKYENAAMQSSSYLRMSPFMNWVSANIGYHHIHHLNARIPFYRLPEAMAAIPALQNPRTTSFAIKDIVASLKLKVWDEDQQSMVSLKNIPLAK
jgi:omega-6 fatty acid desaturase (delta-12 desaturase)